MIFWRRGGQMCTVYWFCLSVINNYKDLHRHLPYHHVLYIIYIIFFSSIAFLSDSSNAFLKYYFSQLLLSIAPVLYCTVLFILHPCYTCKERIQKKLQEFFFKKAFLQDAVCSLLIWLQRLPLTLQSPSYKQRASQTRLKIQIQDPSLEGFQFLSELGGRTAHNKARPSSVFIVRGNG